MIILVTFLKPRSKAASKALLSPSRNCMVLFSGFGSGKAIPFFMAASGIPSLGNLAAVLPPSI